MEAIINNIPQPLVSICIPAFNASEYIAGTLDALLAQTHQHLQIIIVNDHSTDHTMEVINSYLQREPRIKCYQNNGHGAAAARNMAFTKSKGSYIKFFDADDLLNPEAIEQQVALLKKHPECIISGRWGRFIKDLSTFKMADEPVWQDMNGVDWIVRSWEKAQNMTQPGIFMLPRNLVLRSGLWNESLSLNDDLEFYTRLILNAEKVIFCQHAMLYYRSGIRESLSGHKSEAAYLSALQAIELSCAHLLHKDNSQLARKSAAALFQSLLFSIYPQYPHLCKKAKMSVTELGGSDLSFPAGGYTRKLIKLLGWKAAATLKYAFKKQQQQRAKTT
ncbi:Glycosyl transferase, family 2 [Pedobacter sp. BAL39]|uniref:glycosyltransferase family 2 protein n=1 Tax=Pedobacter sp. BAL39 TaxID=391596 RepID=UPI00015593ED|nr:glycosyltransferase family A protein [Pedobacter sp. BAL39]EDM37131.1 Glycosyl transferase, family 2 [Pedobacter sp. BAL39]